jgi:hypothetical protein
MPTFFEGSRMEESRFLSDKSKDDYLKRTSREGALGISKHQRCIILSVQNVPCEIKTRFEEFLSKLTKSMLLNSNLKLD